MDNAKVLADRPVVIPGGVIEGIRRVMVDLHKNGGGNFHLSFPLTGDSYGDVFFRILPMSKEAKSGQG